MKGKTISGYTLDHLLGVGGMAEVWYAENRIGKKAAVKLLLPKLCQDENVTNRFLNEAKVMVELNHPNIRQVYDYGDIEGRPAIVMEYLDGEDLKTRMKHGQHFSDEDLRRWWNQLVDALNYTHRKGVVHRDIKPGNIFVDSEGDVKLLDFGIAKVRESISSTQTGQKLGTLMYMSPEQVKDSKHIDHRTDEYSLAVTFVHLLTGKKPYDSDTSSDFEISEQIVYKPLDLSGVPAGWRDFLAPYLNKDPEQRPELCHYRAADTPVNQAESDAERTIVGDVPKQTAPMQTAPKKQEQGGPENGKPKSKKGLWIGLGIAAVAAVLLFLLLKPKETVLQADPPTTAIQATQTDGSAEAEKKAALEAEQAQKKVEAEKKVSGNAFGHDYVDLGLPNGTLWATCNVGANRPEDYGNYFAWGETQTKATYNWETYRYARGNYDKLTKYCNKSSCGNNGFMDNLATLQSSDDPSTSWGNGWHAPSTKQWQELLDNTTTQWTTQNGVPGRLFTAKNGRMLFLPAAGFRMDSECSFTGSVGLYWSRSLNTIYPYNAWYIDFSSINCSIHNDDGRDLGFPVRPVREK